MGALISIAEAAERSQTPGTEHAPLTTLPALQCAIEIAKILSDLHVQGLSFGSVSFQAVLLAESGATFKSFSGVTRRGDPQDDVRGFGRMVDELFAAPDEPLDPLNRVREEARALASRCQAQACDMRRVFLALRILRLHARHLAVKQASVRETPKAPAVKGRLRLRFVLHWKPLTSLMALVLSRK